jgi:hypothetical protein
MADIQISSQQILEQIKQERRDLNSNLYYKQECHEILTYLNREYRKALKEEKKHKKNKKKGIGITKIKKGTPQKNMCSICLENPDYNNLLKTNCGHYYCKTCYDGWTQLCIKQNETYEVTCPYCRKKNPKLQEYVIKSKPSFHDKP